MVAVSSKKPDDKVLLASSSSGAGSSGSEDAEDDDAISAAVPVMTEYGSSEESDLGPIPDLDFLTSDTSQTAQNAEQLARDDERKQRNRDAARKCRKRRGDQMEVLSQEKRQLEDSNKKLMQRIQKEKESILKMKTLLANCRCHGSLPPLSFRPLNPAVNGLIRHHNGLIFQRL